MWPGSRITPACHAAWWIPPSPCDGVSFCPWIWPWGGSRRTCGQWKGCPKRRPWFCGRCRRRVWGWPFPLLRVGRLAGTRLRRACGVGRAWARAVAKHLYLSKSCHTSLIFVDCKNLRTGWHSWLPRSKFSNIFLKSFNFFQIFFKTFSRYSGWF